MANILLSHFSPVVNGGYYRPICFFDALAEGLAQGGHNVMQLVSTAFLPRYWNGHNGLHDYIDITRLTSDIAAFKPDLCIFANNSVPDTAYKVTDCPVVLFLSDTVKFFNDKDKIAQRAYGDRIYFYAPFQRDLDEIGEMFRMGEERIIHALPATGVVSEAVPVDKNVSFIGNTFQNQKNTAELIGEFKDKERLNQLFSIIRQNHAQLAGALTEDEKALIQKHMPMSHFQSIFSPRDRLLSLALLAEFGLSLYGPDEWLQRADFFPDVAAAWRPDIVYSLKHNQDIYNSSKICLSVAHGQAVEGFPWRVMDVMASNGCLLSDYRQGIADFAKGYVDLPMFDCPARAYELAQKMLKDEAWRRDLVLGSQACIEAKGRWHHRFRDIEEKTGVALTHATPCPPPRGEISYIYGEDYGIGS